MALVTVHTGLASVAYGLGVCVLARPTESTATVAASSDSLFYIAEAFIDGLDGGKDGVLVVGGETVRNVCGRFVAGGLIGRDAAVEGVGARFRLDGGGKVCILALTLSSMYLLVASMLRRCGIPRPWCGLG